MSGCIRGPEWSDFEIRFITENARKFTGADLSRMLAKGGYSRSRNSIIGKLSRLGLSVGKEAPKVARIPKSRPSREPVAKKQKPERPVAIFKPAPPSTPTNVTPLGWPKPKTATAVRFLKMPRVGRCRMPLWGDDEPLESRFCCGAETVGLSPYCPGCRVVIYQPTAKKLAGVSA